MSFGVTAEPTSFTLQPGGSQDVVFTFTGVPAEVFASALVPFDLGAQSVTVALGVTLEEPDPAVGFIEVPAGVTATVLSIDDQSATLRFAR